MVAEENAFALQPLDCYFIALVHHRGLSCTTFRHIKWCLRLSNWNKCEQTKNNSNPHFPYFFGIHTTPPIWNFENVSLQACLAQGVDCFVYIVLIFKVDCLRIPLKRKLWIDLHDLDRCSPGLFFSAHHYIGRC